MGRISLVRFTQDIHKKDPLRADYQPSIFTYVIQQLIYDLVAISGAGPDGEYGLECRGVFEVDEVDQ